MSQFVYTDKGFVNITEIKAVRPDNKGKQRVFNKQDQEIDGDASDFFARVVSIIPTQGDWECLFQVLGGEGDGEICAEPVIAWGLTPLGRTVPVTPTTPDGIFSDFALRKAGDQAVYADETIFQDADDWLRYLKRLKA